MVKRLGRWLIEHPLEFEHHKSRLLARVAQVQHIEGAGALAQAAVEFQSLLAGESDRSDSRIVADLERRRKFDVYESPESPESALLAYLRRDSECRVEDVDEAVFRIYRILLNVQIPERAKNAINRAIENLTRWLDQLHWRGIDADSQIVGEMLDRARINTPWDELSLKTARHLQVQHELLPGPDHPEDVLALLRTKYTSPDSESILVRALRMFQELPLIRTRTSELCDFVLDDYSRMQRSVDVWQAFLELIDSMITGVDDFILSADALIHLPADERAERGRELQARKSLLKSDSEFRSLLYRLSTDRKLVLSADDDTASKVRELSWRVLLRSLPDDCLQQGGGADTARPRLDYFKEGILEHDQRLAIATLEEASHLRVRDVWEIIEQNGGALVGSSVPAAERKNRLHAITALFERTRNYEAVANNGQSLGLLLKLAFHEDRDLRTPAKQAINNAGYKAEYLRERQKRRLFKLRSELTEREKRVTELELQIGELSGSITEQQVERTDVRLRIQELLQQRDILVTCSWINTTRMQVDLQEIREALRAALEEQAKEERVLSKLNERMSDALRKSKNIQSKMERLVDDQRSNENRISDCEITISNKRERMHDIGSEKADVQRELAYLRDPIEPPYSGDEEHDRRLKDQFRREVSEHKHARDRLEGTQRRLDSEYRECDDTIRSCKRQIEAAEATLEQLRHAIHENRQKIAEIEDRLSALQSDYYSGQARWEALRRRIDELDHQAQSIENRVEEERRSTMAAVNENESAVRANQDELNVIDHELHTSLNQLTQTSDERDREVVRCQEKAQAIDEGLKRHRRLGGEAKVRSRRANARGISLEQQLLQLTLLEEEQQVHYTGAMQEALEGKDAPEPRTERRPRRSRPIQRDSK